jgi:hypothetical protein
VKLNKRRVSFHRVDGFHTKDTSEYAYLIPAIEDRPDMDTDVDSHCYRLMYHPFENMYGGKFGKFRETPRFFIRDLLEGKDGEVPWI